MILSLSCSFARKAIVVLLLFCALLPSCSGGGGAETPPPAQPTPAPTPMGYVLKQTRLNDQTLVFALERTADEPLIGLSFDLVFPQGTFGIAVGDKSSGPVMAAGTVGVAVDDADQQRVVVAGGKDGSDAVRGVGELLRFRLGFASTLPAGVVPQVQNLRFFRGATAGEFADEVSGTMPFSVVVAP